MHPDRRETVAQTCLKNLTIRGVQAKSLYRGAEGVGTSACLNGTRRRCADPNTIRDERAEYRHEPVISDLPVNMHPSLRPVLASPFIEESVHASNRRAGEG
jgi:hypothetical protein